MSTPANWFPRNDGNLTPSDAYDAIEAWWGTEFNDELVGRMISAPKKHQRAFAASLSEEFDLPIPDAIPPGKLRPVFGASVSGSSSEIRTATALRVLLYAHEAVLSEKDLPDFDPDHHRNSKEYAESLTRFLRIRPLVLDGSIKFTPTFSIGLHPAFMGGYERLLQQPETRALAEGLLPPGHDDVSDDDLFSTFMACFGGLNAACVLATERRGHTLALSQSEEMIRDALLGQPLSDNRHAALKKLGSFAVPDMRGDVSALVKVRQSDEQFADWRQHLSRALSNVAELSDDEGSLADAEVVFEELSSSLAGIRKTTDKSAALQALQGGLSGFAITGITAGTSGLMTGSPWVALVSGAAGKIADAARTYVQTIQKQRHDRLILDLAMSFKPIKT
jgi:hypothetical protein